MAQQPKASVPLNDFGGLVNNLDARDLPPGTANVQVNATCVKMGELQVRLGLKEVSFEAS